MPVTYTFSNGTVVSASEVNTNFTDLLNETTGLTVADMHTSSGLLSTNLADRFSVSRDIIYLPGDTTWDDETVSPGVEIARSYFNLRTGKAAYLCGMSFYCQDISGVTTDTPVFWFTHNGVVLGAGSVSITAASSVRHFRNTNPIDDPIKSIAHDDYLTVNFGRIGSAGDTITISNMLITITYKTELGA